MSAPGPAALSAQGALLQQAHACEVLGSPMYARVLRAAAEDFRAGGACAALLKCHAQDPAGSALALRFLAAMHRRVLAGLEPGLAAHYPSVGGSPGAEGLESAFLAAVGRSLPELRVGIRQEVQTNEVGRCAILCPGFLEVARRTGLPLRCLEIGASAGLHLRWDHYHYEAGGQSWGPAHSPVRFGPGVLAPDVPLHGRLEVVERAGCDLHPLDPAGEESRLTLRSFLWPDQPERRARLDAAMGVAVGVPARLDRASAAEWLPAQLHPRHEGVTTVGFHSIVMQYLRPEERVRIAVEVERAGAAARPGAPFAWLEYEQEELRTALHATIWPGGARERWATATAHGRDVEWVGPRGPGDSG